MRIRLLVALLLATTALPSAERKPILIASAKPGDLERKLQAEAAHVGLALEPRLLESGAEGEALVEQGRALALIEVLSPDRVRLRVARSAEHRASDVVIVRSPADGSSFATRVVEQLRGRLVELRLLYDPNVPDAPAESQAAAAEPTVAPPLPAELPRPALPQGDRPSGATGAAPVPIFGVTVGGGGSLALGGVGFTPGLALGLRVEPSASLSVAANALLPVTENELDEDEGEADVLVSLFIADLGYDLLSKSSRFGVDVGPGAGLAVLQMDAETAPPRQAHAERLAAGLFFAHGGFAYRPSPWFRLRATLRAGVVAPRPVMRFDGREVAAWGRGFMATTVGAELAWSPGAAR